MDITTTTSKRRRKERDHSLIKQILGENQLEKNKAIAELYGYYIPYFKHYFKSCFHNEEDAKDMANDFIIQILKNINKFKFTYAFSTWANRVAHNYLIDCIRKDNRKFSTVSIDNYITTDNGEQLKPEFPGESKTPQQIIEQKERYQELHHRLQNISPQYQKIIQLRYFDELSYAEIANELNISLGAVKTQLFRAKSELRKLYD